MANQRSPLLGRGKGKKKGKEGRSSEREREKHAGRERERETGVLTQSLGKTKLTDSFSQLVSMSANSSVPEANEDLRGTMKT
ncbi:hypothetical protein AMELA_G00178130 [Ameiurus melas]|uniref:Uncharacterized protein n=1 Tax=Ameiurus melas TaxID=219545 RepID=A0A7J6ADA2_AMEME|nr:hypothetical protein AMELA_G00178130 [Ameiurus melas]